MGILQDLPTLEQIEEQIRPILGDETTDAGMGAVLTLLDSIDTANLSASLTGSLDDGFSVDVSFNADDLIGDARSQFQAAAAAFPTDASFLVEPLTEKFESLKTISTGEINALVSSSVNGLQDINALFPVDVGMLVSDLSVSLGEFKGEFIVGQFAQLRRWSESVLQLYAEIEPLVAAGPAGLEARLIGFLEDKVADLVKLTLPSPSLHLAISGGLDAALSLDRLKTIDALKLEIVELMGKATLEFDAGNFSNTAHFAAAEAKFNQLGGILADIVAKLNAALEISIATPEGLSLALQQQYDNFLQIEIVDLGNIKEKFAAAIKQVQDAIDGLELDAALAPIDELFAEIDGVIGRFELPSLTDKLNGLEGQINSVLGGLDSSLFEAVASIRTVFRQIRDSLNSIASSLGSFDADGNFQFHVQQDVEDFLNGVNSNLTDTIQPIMEDFRTLVGQTLQQVADGLSGVQDQIESVKANLTEMLSGVHTQLQSLDVAGTMEAMRQELEEMLSGLGEIDFNPVVDPVIAQIDEMSGALAQIDVSAMSEVTIGAFELSVEVVVSVDFSGQITVALMSEFDEILMLPEKALREFEGKIEGALQQFGRLEPSVLLAPLDEVFEPISVHLEALNLDNLLKPLNDWHAKITATLDQISPATLMKPLLDLHGELSATLNSISPTTLVEPLHGRIDGLKSEILQLDFSSLTGELEAEIDKVKAGMNEISPEKLMQPLVDLFDKILTALDGFDPAILLEPFEKVFGALATPLANLTADHAKSISAAFSVLRDVLQAFDPHFIFKHVAEAFQTISELLQQLNLGGMIGQLQSPYNDMKGSFEANGGPVNVSLSVSVEGLNPLRAPSIGEAISELQKLQGKIDAMARAQPSAELVSTYEQDVKEPLESLIPTWAREGVSPDSIRRAFQEANPLSLTAEVNALFDSVKNQLKTFDPRVIQEKLKASFQKLEDSLFVLEPSQLGGAISGTIESVVSKIDALNLEIFVEEIQGLSDEVTGILTGLDPTPIIAQLQGSVDVLKQSVEAIKPSNLLAELEAPLQTAGEIIAAFDPAIIKEPIQAVFDEILQILEAIDIGVVLQPIADRLKQLRSELEEALKRTETAFNGMLQAIPI